MTQNRTDSCHWQTSVSSKIIDPCMDVCSFFLCPLLRSILDVVVLVLYFAASRRDQATDRNFRGQTGYFWEVASLYHNFEHILRVQPSL